MCRCGPLPDTTRAMRLDDVRKLALAMPDVVEAKSYGTPAFKVRGKLLARIREEGVLVVVTEPDAKEALIASNSRVYFKVPHYDGYDMVLVRLPRVKPGELRDRSVAARSLTSTTAT